MKRRSLAMIIAALALDLGLFLCAAGVTRESDSGGAWPARRHPRAANTTLPNHLLEEKPPAPAQPALGPTTATAVNGTDGATATSVAPAVNGGTRQWGSSARVATRAIPTATTRPVELPCNCSSEGALDPEDCDRTTGQCSCIPGYVGLQCETCEDGYFNNGTTGCLPCGCDSFGAVDHLCNSSGMCTCKTGVYGPQCDDCQPGYFRFSSTGCQPCQCHNHSSYCHPQSGICLECQGNTQGPACEECKPGFYRTPGAAQTDNCLPCPCSDLTSTGTCHADASSFPVCDSCKPGYNGSICNRCADGFYLSAGICLPCDCSGNADPLAFPRVCDPVTGYCLSCANHTAGPRCEHCASGYAGNALGQGCFRIDLRVLPVPENTTEATTTATTNETTSTSSSPTSTTPSNSTESTTTLTTTMSSTTTTVTMTPKTTTTVTVTTTPTTTTTVTTTPNPTVTTTLSGSLGSPTDNTTAAVAAVSWAQFNIIILAVIIVAVVLLMGVAAAIYTYREYRNRKLNAPFWTIELKEDNISFSSYHDSLPNADVSGLLEGEGGEVAPSGQLALNSPPNMYKA